MKLTLYVPVIRNNNEGLISTNPLALMLTQQAAYNYLLNHAKVCHSVDEISYRIARYELLNNTEYFTYSGQEHYVPMSQKDSLTLVKTAPGAM